MNSQVDNTWKPELSRKQSDAWWLLQKDYVDELLYGGAKGGGKSVFGCLWMYAECYELAREYVPKPRKHPIPVGFIGRKVAKHLKETTLDTWKRFIPKDRYTIKGDPAEIVIADRVMIRTGGLEAKEELEKFNSAEFARIFIDQAEETSEDDISVLRATQRLVIGKKKIIGKILWTANPAQCWLKREFVDKKRRSHPFVRALPSDNHWTGREYIKILEKAFSYRPELLAAYRDGLWEAIASTDQIIKDIWIREAQERRLSSMVRRPRVVCDPARFGDDERVIYYAEGTNILEQDIAGKSSTPQTARDCIAMSVRHGGCPIIVEEDGIGGGVIDDLREMGHTPRVFLASSQASNPDRFGNLRAEAWFGMSKRFAEGQVEFRHKNMSSHDLTTLVQQLTSPKYHIRNGKIFVEKKEDIKKRLGGSPDRADAYMLLDWSYDRVPAVPEDEIDYYEDDSEVASYEVQSVL